MTVWPARRVDTRLLCGRQTSVSGGCRGEIARINDGGEAPVAELQFGMIEDPPGSHYWRPSNRAKAQMARGQRRVGGHAVRAMRAGRVDGRIFATTRPALPWTRHCPVCHVLAEVTASVLRSE